MNQFKSGLFGNPEGKYLEEITIENDFADVSCPSDEIYSNDGLLKSRE